MVQPLALTSELALVAAAAMSHTYIDAQGAVALKAYQYRGADLSLIYRFVLQPLNDVLLRYVVPMWLAPNAMSLLGFAFTFQALLLTAYYNPLYSSLSLPQWLPLYVAVSFFIYQTIDNLDGRQARRTRSSSPLGLLFDHGVDALTVSTGALTLGAVFQFGTHDLLYQLSFWCCGCLPFLFATWCEYWTGELILEIVNGPTDGMIVCMGFMIAATVTPNLWANTVQQQLPLLALYAPTLAALPMGVLIQIVGYAGIIPTVACNVYAVSQRRALLRGPLQMLFPFLSLVLTTLTWALYSPQQLFHQQPRLFLLTAGVLFANLICKLMLAHLTDKHYNTWRWELLPYVATAVTAVLFHALPVTELTALLLLFAYVLLLHAHFIVFVVRDMKSILNIHCFTIVDITKVQPAANNSNSKTL